MSEQRKPIIWHPGEGRRYHLGKGDRIEVLFKTDGAEVDDGYTVTEWWMEPRAPGLDPHVHDVNDELIFVLDGTASILLGEDWKPYEKGSFVTIPAGTSHGFRNETEQRMGLLNIFLSGAFEAMMPQIQAMFAAKG